MQIETYGFSVDDFKRAKISTTTPEDYECKECRAKPGQPCESKGLPNGFIFHQSRVQAQWDQAKSVIESVEDRQIIESRVIEL